jgi:predicted nucleic acid-binding protein
MSVVDVNIFIQLLMKDSDVRKIVRKDFMKYENGQFEVFVYDNKALVVDKRNTKKTIVYNNISIAKANLIHVK